MTDTILAKATVPEVAPTLSAASVMIPFNSDRNDIVEINKAPVGFSSGFARVSGIIDY